MTVKDHSKPLGNGLTALGVLIIVLVVAFWPAIFDVVAFYLHHWIEVLIAFAAIVAVIWHGGGFGE